MTTVLNFDIIISDKFQVITSSQDDDDDGDNDDNNSSLLHVIPFTD